ncbi:DUF4174 domain-containing protein [Iningainema tapete]|uniref:DUF4174 domain-containing protein n=1 Tax=Iningainema tapete BLCC-T55 TaxID=2748662 RepID=A0A8J7BWT8_9CYAN|nr:DUF4174 domain-containing protein [Iningainema tapete]MBD2772442.1 DUF4174 domain-containing protein [Iningainema tapete BLCC-T55]
MKKSALLLLPLLTFLFLSPVSKAGATPAQTNQTVKMSSFNLSSQKWKNRVLLVFAPSEKASAYQQQMQLFNQYKPGFADRDLVLVQVLADEESNANLRDRFDVGKDDFRVILVGKDGGVKSRYNSPVQAKAIFNEIDAMPMRRQEMRERGR